MRATLYIAALVPSRGNAVILVYNVRAMAVKLPMVVVAYVRKLLTIIINGRSWNSDKRSSESLPSSRAGGSVAAAAFDRYPIIHLITLSARASTCGGIVRPICFAVFRLIKSSNLVGCSTGKSAGLAPLRILSI